MATCPDCLAELFDPADRRFGYPFLNCTNCGPRLTIITGAPYDRGGRRWRRSRCAPPAGRSTTTRPTAASTPSRPPARTAARASGLLDAAGQPIATRDPLGLFAEALRAGKIGALKGLGGYHLACDARNAAAVAELRRRKHRDEKPFAVMVADLEAAAALCEVGAGRAGAAAVAAPARSSCCASGRRASSPRRWRRATPASA